MAYMTNYIPANTAQTFTEYYIRIHVAWIGRSQIPPALLRTDFPASHPATRRLRRVTLQTLVQFSSPCVTVAVT